MGSQNITRLLALARQAALDAGEVVMDIYQSGDFTVQQKSDSSPITQADRAAHQIISDHLHASGLPILSEESKDFPFEEQKNWDWYWLIDPLDGTKEFIGQNSEFTINIALMHQHKPLVGVIFVPAAEVLYAGSEQTGVTKEINGTSITLKPAGSKKTFTQLEKQKGLRIIASRSHLIQETRNFINRFNEPLLQVAGSSLKFMLLAENQADLYPRFSQTSEWDVAAGHAILKALNKNIYLPDLTTELPYQFPDFKIPAFVAF